MKSRTNSAESSSATDAARNATELRYEALQPLREGCDERDVAPLPSARRPTSGLHMKHKTTSTCDGCGQRTRFAWGGGLWIRPGFQKPIPWILCRTCTTELDADSQGMLMRIELRLEVMQGT
jgi:hypothetical protein